MKIRRIVYTIGRNVLGIWACFSLKYNYYVYFPIDKPPTQPSYCRDPGNAGLSHRAGLRCAHLAGTAGKVETPRGGRDDQVRRGPRFRRLWDYAAQGCTRAHLNLAQCTPRQQGIKDLLVTLSPDDCMLLNMFELQKSTLRLLIADQVSRPQDLICRPVKTTCESLKQVSIQCLFLPHP